MNPKNNKGKVILFVLFLLLIIIGGYFLMVYLTQPKIERHHLKKPKTESLEDLRIDFQKDYIYYVDDKSLIAENEIYYKNVVINLVNMAFLNTELKKENEVLLNTLKYTKDVKLDESKTYQPNYEGIYSLNYREYEDNVFKDYINLIIYEYYYDIETGITPSNIKGYVINKKTGKLVDEEELLNVFQVDWSKIKEGVKKRLNDTQVLTESQENIINIDDTLNNLDKYALTVSKNGKLKITFIVKSSHSNYNDSVEIN